MIFQLQKLNERKEIILGGYLYLLSIASKIESITGESFPSAYCKRYIQISKDAGATYSDLQEITYSDWTSNNFVSLIIDLVKSLYYVKIVYEKAGDNTTLITLNSLSLTVNTNPSFTYNSSAYDKTTFKKIISDNKECFDIAQNLFLKIFNGNILPKYLQRENQYNGTENFTSFWFTKSLFFSFIICVFEKISTFKDNTETLHISKEFLKQRGLFFCQDDITEADLSYLIENFYREITKRGTYLPFKEYVKYNQIPTENIQGEFLRLICYNVLDEMLICNLKPNNFGWVIDKSSPLFRELGLEDELNKFYVNTITNLNISQIPTGGVF